MNVGDVDLVVTSFTYGLSFGAAGTDNNVVFAEVERAEGFGTSYRPEYMLVAQELRQGVLQVGGADIAVVKGRHFSLVVDGRVDWRFREEFMNLE